MKYRIDPASWLLHDGPTRLTCLQAEKRNNLTTIDRNYGAVGLYYDPKNQSFYRVFPAKDATRLIFKINVEDIIKLIDEMPCEP